MALVELPLIANGGVYNPPGGTYPYDTTKIVVLDNGWLVAAYSNPYNNGNTTSKMFVLCSKDSGATWQNVAILTGSTKSVLYENMMIASKGNKVALQYAIRDSGGSLANSIPVLWVIDVPTFTFGTTYTNRHDGGPAGSSSADYNIYSNLQFTSSGNLVRLRNYYGNGSTHELFMQQFSGTSPNAFISSVTVASVSTEYNQIASSEFVECSDGSYVALWYSQYQATNFSYYRINSAMTTSTFLGTQTNGFNPKLAFNPVDNSIFLFYIFGGKFTLQRSTDNGSTWNGNTEPNTYGNTMPILGMSIDKNGRLYLIYVARQNRATSTGNYVLYSYEVTTTGGTITWVSDNTLAVPSGAMLHQKLGFGQDRWGNKGIIAWTFSDWWTSNTLQRMWSDVKVLNAAPNAPTITSPTSGQKVNTRTPTITWTFSDPDAGNTQSAFNVQIVNSAYSAILWDSGWISSSATSYALPAGAITADGTYYVRMMVKDNSGVVNTANGRGPDPSFDNIQFIVDTVLPTGSRADANPRYLNASNKTAVTFTVNAADNVLLNNVQFAVWGDSGGQNDIVWYNGTNNGNGTWSKTVNFNSHDGGIDQHYNVHVYAYDQAGNSANIAIYDVWVDTRNPDAPTQTNGVLYATSNGVSWTAFSDGAASSGLLLTTMNLQSWNGSAWVNVATYPKSVTGITHSFTGLTPGTQYRWGVTYTDNSSNVSTLNYTTFTTNTYSVTTTVNLASAGSILNQKPKIKFTATDANDATLSNFQIQISTVNTFASTVLDTTSSVVAAGWGATSLSSGGTNSYTPQVNLPVGTLYVRMRAYDGKDWGTWSATITMIIKAISWPTTIADADTAISKRTIDNIRIEINNVRQARGLAVANWTDSVIKDWNDPARTSIRMGHLIEIRQAIVDIYSALSLIAPTWTDNIISTSTVRKGKHWSELRTYLAAC